MFATRSLLGLGIVLTSINLIYCGETAFLQERHQVGDQYHVSARSDVSGRLTPPAQKDNSAPRPVDIHGDSIFEYDERILSLDADGLATRTLRYCQKMTVEREVGGQPQRNHLRDEVRRLVVMRENQKKAPFSPDGPLTWTEIDLVRTDVFVPHLLGLLPQREVTTGDRWAAATSAVLELTGMTDLTTGSLQCTFERIAMMNRRQQAHVTLSGTLKGLNEDGPLEQTVEGHFLFDLADNYLAYLYIRGTHRLLKDGVEMGKISGRFVLNRELSPQATKLSDDAIRGLSVEPTASNTLLLYENDELGLRFLYPRRWRVGSEQDRQINLEAPGGLGLLITAESAEKTPTAASYLAGAHGFLRAQQGTTIHKIRQATQLSKSPLLEEFSMDVEAQGDPRRMQYYVTKQRLGGVLLAGRLPYRVPEVVQQEVEAIARSVRVTKRIP